jgi:hypothetical protein
MHYFTSAVLAFLGGCAILTAEAADPKLKELPEPPPMSQTPPAAEMPADRAEPEITITTQGTERHEEYRVRGQLYMIKVTPTHGKPYYLIDNEGSGQFSRSDFAPSVKVPMWVIKRF